MNIKAFFGGKPPLPKAQPGQIQPDGGLESTLADAPGIDAAARAEDKKARELLGESQVQMQRQKDSKPATSSGPLASIFAKPAAEVPSSSAKTNSSSSSSSKTPAYKPRMAPFKDPLAVLDLTAPPPPPPAPAMAKENASSNSSSSSSSSKSSSSKITDSESKKAKPKQGSAESKDTGSKAKAKSSSASVADTASKPKSSSAKFFLTREEKEAQREKERVEREEREERARLEKEMRDAEAREQRIQAELARHKQLSTGFKKEGSGVNAFFSLPSEKGAKGAAFMGGDWGREVDFDAVRFAGGVHVGLPSIDNSREGNNGLVLTTIARRVKFEAPSSSSGSSSNSISSGGSAVSSTAPGNGSECITLVAFPSPLSLGAQLTLSPLDRRALWMRYQFELAGGGRGCSKQPVQVIDLSHSDPSDIVDMSRDEVDVGMALLGAAPPFNQSSVAQLSAWLLSWAERCRSKKEAAREQRERSLMEPAVSGKKRNRRQEEERLSPCDLINLAYLHGPAGSGKTSTVYRLAREMGFDVIEISASDLRSGAACKKSVSEAAQSHGLLETDGREGGGMTVLLFDDADVVLEEDSGFHAFLQQLQRSSLVPVVLTGSTDLRLPSKRVCLKDASKEPAKEKETKDKGDKESKADREDRVARESDDRSDPRSYSTTLNWLRTLVQSEEDEVLCLSMERPTVGKFDAWVGGMLPVPMVAADAGVSADTSAPPPVASVSPPDLSALLAVTHRCDLRAATQTCSLVYTPGGQVQFPSSSSGTLSVYSVQQSGDGVEASRSSLPAWLLGQGFDFAILDSIHLLADKSAITNDTTMSSPPVLHPSLQPLACPLVSSVEPRSQREGGLVTITGKHFLQRGIAGKRGESEDASDVYGLASVTVFVGGQCVSSALLSDSEVCFLMPAKGGAVEVVVGVSLPLHGENRGADTQTLVRSRVSSSLCGSVWVRQSLVVKKTPLYANRGRKGGLSDWIFGANQDRGKLIAQVTEAGADVEVVEDEDIEDSDDDDDFEKVKPGLRIVRSKNSAGATGSNSRRRRVMDDEDQPISTTASNKPTKPSSAGEGSNIFANMKHGCPYRPSAALSVAATALDQLTANPIAAPFLYKVTKRDAPDYDKVIAEPMWLERVRERFVQGHYADESVASAETETETDSDETKATSAVKPTDEETKLPAFSLAMIMRDVGLIWANCLDYNGRSMPISAAAKTLQRQWQAAIRSLEQGGLDEENEEIDLETEISPETTGEAGVAQEDDGIIIAESLPLVDGASLLALLVAAESERKSRYAASSVEAFTLYPSSSASSTSESTLAPGPLPYLGTAPAGLEGCTEEGCLRLPALQPHVFLRQADSVCSAASSSGTRVDLAAVQDERLVLSDLTSLDAMLAGLSDADLLIGPGLGLGLGLGLGQDIGSSTPSDAFTMVETDGAFGGAGLEMADVLRRGRVGAWRSEKMGREGARGLRDAAARAAVSSTTVAAAAADPVHLEGGAEQQKPEATGEDSNVMAVSTAEEESPRPSRLVRKPGSREEEPEEDWQNDTSGSVSTRRRPVVADSDDEADAYEEEEGDEEEDEAEWDEEEEWSGDERKRKRTGKRTGGGGKAARRTTSSRTRSRAVPPSTGGRRSRRLAEEDEDEDEDVQLVGETSKEAGSSQWRSAIPHLRGHLGCLTRRGVMLGFVMDTLVASGGREGRERGAWSCLVTNGLRRTTVDASLVLDYLPLVATMLKAEAFQHSVSQTDFSSTSASRTAISAFQFSTGGLVFTSSRGSRHNSSRRGPTKFEFTARAIGLSEEVCEGIVHFGNFVI